MGPRHQTHKTVKLLKSQSQWAPSKPSPAILHPTDACGSAAWLPVRKLHMRASAIAACQMTSREEERPRGNAQDTHLAAINTGAATKHSSRVVGHTRQTQRVTQIDEARSLQGQVCFLRISKLVSSVLQKLFRVRPF
eukprot:1538965-Amphidinium_carterae.1